MDIETGQPEGYDWQLQDARAVEQGREKAAGPGRAAHLQWVPDWTRYPGRDLWSQSRDEKLGGNLDKELRDMLPKGWLQGWRTKLGPS